MLVVIIKLNKNMKPRNNITASIIDSTFKEYFMAITSTIVFLGSIFLGLLLADYFIKNAAILLLCILNKLEMYRA